MVSTWYTAEGEGVCGNGTQLTLGLVLEGGQPTQGSVRERDAIDTGVGALGWAANTGVCVGTIAAQCEVLIRGSADQSFFKAGGDDICFHTVL